MASNIDLCSQSATRDDRNACLDCLRGALSSSNGFLGFATRAVIDSMVLTCLLRPTDSSPGNPFGWSSVQCRIFQLASTCVATPWNDGSSTSILSSLKRSAIKACIESDEAVSLAAKEALRVCDLYGIPRAPPLVFVHRTLGEGSLRMEQMAPKIIEDIQNAKVEASRARQAVDEAAETKVREKRQRELERKESNKRKRDAKEMIKNEMQEITSNVVDLGTEKETTQVDSQQERQDAQELYTDVDDGMDGNEEKEDERRNEPQGKFEGVASSDEADDKDDDDFPDIDIVADGPDSDDD